MFGMPLHFGGLKIGIIIILLCSLNPPTHTHTPKKKNRLYHRMHLVIKLLHNNFVATEISKCNNGIIPFILRINLAPSDVNLPFILKPYHFPITPINKARSNICLCGSHLDEAVIVLG